MIQLFYNALVAGSLSALMAGGLALVYGVLGVFNMALGQMALMAGYITWWLHQVHELPLGLSIVGGIVAGAALSWIVFYVFVHPFYKRHRFLPIVTTIALSMMLDALMLMLFEERPRSILPGLKTMIEVGGGRISTEQLVLVGCTLAALGVFAWVLHSTAFGRRIRAVVQHPHAAMSLGVHASMLHQIIFVVSGVLAACGGVFMGIDQNLTPSFAFPVTIKAYAALIAGGKGNFWGTIICAYIIALLEQLAIGTPWFFGRYIAAGYQETIALLFIILILLLKPSGLFARKSRIA